ncbi:MAG: response regulator transcription factor [Planctomycetota bacterium]|jgi:DNA-binding response OmpR family regulator
MRILLVEDSRRLQASLSTGLRRSGHGVDIAGDGEAALVYARHNEYDVIVLDLMLPKLGGLEVLRQLRADDDATHVLILTARDTVDDRVRGLRAGADDYLVKPFEFDELLARLEALVRRQYGAKDPVLEIGELRIDTAAKTVHRGDRAIELTAREYALLEFLAFRSGEVVTRRDIEDHLYDERSFPVSNAVDRAVCSLRAKLGGENGDELIRTRRGIGYVLVGAST